MPPKSTAEKKCGSPPKRQRSAAGPTTAVVPSPALRLVFPKDAPVLLGILAVAVVLFSNGLSPELVFDDTLAISRNKDAATDQGVSLSEVFFHDFWGHKLYEVSSNGSYRPFTILSFRLQYWLAGRRHSGVFLHLFNYAVAYFNVCLVYFLARLYHQMLLSREGTGFPDGAAAPPTSSAEEKVVNGKAHGGPTEPYTVPAMAALVFLVHPVHVDAVTSIVGRSELLCCLFGLLSFFAMHAFAVHPSPRGRTHKKPIAASQRGQRRLAACGFASAEGSAVALLGLVVGLMVFCVLCKDSGVIFTGIYLLHAFLLYTWGFSSRKRLAAVVLASVTMALLYFTFRRVFVGEVDLKASRLLRRTENPQYFIPAGVWHWLSMRWTIQVKNLELLFYPTKLCCEYSYNCIPHMESIRDSRFPYYVAVSSALLLVLLTLVYRAWVRRSRLAVLLLAFLMWIAIPYAPVSHIFAHVGTFIAERCLYIPSIGVALLYAFTLRPSFAAWNVTNAAGYARWAKVWGLLTLVALWFAVSYHRNPAWATNVSLFQEAVKVCPNSGKSHNQLATAMSAKVGKLTPEIVALYQRGLALDPEEKGPYYYLAIDQWQNHHNARKAYDMIRLCVRSPFSVSQCYPLYAEMRGTLFPNMTPVEKLLDEASIAPLASQRAQRYRGAGLLQRSQAAGGDPCAGVDSLQRALRLWNESQLFWSSEEAHPEYTENTFCNTAYWWANAVDECVLRSGAPGAPVHAEGRDGEGKPLPSVGPPPTNVSQAMNDMYTVASVCATNWRAPGVVRGASRQMLLHYGNRLKEFVPLMIRLKTSLAHMKPLLSGEEERRLAKLTALALAVGEYCGVVTLIEDVDVKRTLGQYFSQDVARHEEYAAEHQGRWRLEILSLWKEVLQLHSANEGEYEGLSPLTEGIRLLAQCSPSLSASIA